MFVIVPTKSEIPPQITNFQTFSLKELFSFEGNFLTLCTLVFCVKFQPFSPKAAHFGIEKHPKLQFSAQWNGRNLMSRIGRS